MSTMTMEQMQEMLVALAAKNAELEAKLENKARKDMTGFIRPNKPESMKGPTSPTHWGYVTVGGKEWKLLGWLGDKGELKLVVKEPNQE